MPTILKIKWLIILFLIVALCNITWLGVDTRPPSWDESIHLSNAIGYTKILKESHGKIKALLELSDFYPPLFEFITGVFFFILGPSADLGSIVNLLFIAILIFSTYSIGAKIASKEIGVLASILIMSYPQIVHHSKFYMLDLPLTAFVSLAMYIFLAADNFKRLSFSIIFGIISGLGLLLKWNFLFYVGPLFAAYFIIAIRSKDKKQALNILLVILIAMFIAGPWYGMHFGAIARNAFINAFARGKTEGDPAVFSWASLTHYGTDLIEQVSAFSWIIIIASLIWLIFTWKKQASLLKWWIIAPWVILTLIRNKDSRHTMAILPAFAILSSICLNSIKPTFFKRSVIVAVLLVITLQFFYVNFAFAPLNLDKLYSKTLIKKPFCYAIPPKKENWQIEPALTAVLNEIPNSNRNLTVRIIPDHQYINNCTFAFEVTRKNLPIDVIGTTNFPNLTDAVILKTGYQGPDFSNIHRKSLVEDFLNKNKNLTNIFKEVKAIPLPDNSNLIIFIRDIKPVNISSAQFKKTVQKNLTDLLNNYAKDAKKLSLDIETISNKETRLGHFKTIKLTADLAVLGDFSHKPHGVVSGPIAIRLDNAIINPHALLKGEPIQLLSLDAIIIETLKIHENDINKYLNETAVKEIKNMDVSFKNGAIHLKGYITAIKRDVSISAALKVTGTEKTSQNIDLNILSLNIGFLKIPSFLVNQLIPYGKPLFNLKGFSGKLKLGKLTIDNGFLYLTVK